MRDQSVDAKTDMGWSHAGQREEKCEVSGHLAGSDTLKYIHHLTLAFLGYIL